MTFWKFEDGEGLLILSTIVQQEPEEEERVPKEDSGYEHAEGEESHQAPPPGNREVSRLMLVQIHSHFIAQYVHNRFKPF